MLFHILHPTLCYTKEKGKVYIMALFQEKHSQNKLVEMSVLFYILSVSRARLHQQL